MMVLGLQGSPRKNGNTDFLLSTFMKEVEKSGVITQNIRVDKKNIAPCLGCGYCEKEGYCIIQDDMSSEIYPLFRKADVIVAATPIFFYNVTAQLKALIDRSQAIWSRKYKFNLLDPGHKTRRGFLLALGATKGKNLFEGVELTAKYFFDAVGAKYEGGLTYRRIEKPGDMEKHATVRKDVKVCVDKILKPLLNRKKILFACRENACRSQIAAAFAQNLAGDKVEVLSGGSTPADEINQKMVKVMEEKGIDLAFQRPKSIKDAILHVKPDTVITMGCGEDCPYIPGAEEQDWDLPDPADKPIDFMRGVRDKIFNKVTQLLG